MSNKIRPAQYADARGVIVEDFDRNILFASGTAAPADATAGYAVGALFFKKLGAAGAQVYINEGTTSSCAFKALGSQAAGGVAATAVVGVAAGYKIARGTVTLDGSNPTTAATGLTTIVAACTSLKQTAAPGDDPSWLSHSYTGSDGNLDIYAWKNTGGTDPTLVASTNNTATVDWIAIGT